MEKGINNEVDVLVIGAGPTGLVLTSQLASQGVSCRIVDKAPEPSATSRANVIQPRTLEVFEDMGIVDEVMAGGKVPAAITFYSEGHQIVRLKPEGLDSHYSTALIIPQRESERILVKHQEGLGQKIERGVELAGFEQDEDKVSSTLLYQDGGEEVVHSRWLVGCDGAHSKVRNTLGIPFEGIQYKEPFILADIKVDWSLALNELFIFLSRGQILAAFPMPGENRYRLFATRSKSDPRAGGEPTLEEFQDLVDSRLGPGSKLSDPEWLAVFQLHRRIVPRLSQGRVFLAGDAAHINSPAGGQGMNTGIQDAYNLAWKLGLVAAGKGKDELLDSYHLERHPVAQTVVRGTHRAFRAALSDNPLLRLMRRFIVPILSKRDRVNRWIRVAASELNINYRRSPIAVEDGFRSGPAAGERAPDGPVTNPATGQSIRLFEAFHGPRHTLLLFSGSTPTSARYEDLEKISKMFGNGYDGEVSEKLIVAGEKPSPNLNWNGSILHDRKGWLHQRYGASSSCLYLVRPDGYVGFRSQPANGKSLGEYLGLIFKEKVIS